MENPENQKNQKNQKDQHEPSSQTGQKKETRQEDSGTDIQLPELFAFKKFMTTVFNDKREAIPVTYLKYEPWFVSQLKTKKKEGYDAVQISCRAKPFKRSSKAERGHFKKTNFEHAAYFVKEVRGELPKEAKIGSKLSLTSLSKGDRVKITARSKGRGFSGTIKRWGFGGGPASHGSQFHRRTGSVGNCTWPGRVMPGRKMPGQFGFKNQSLHSVEVIDVLAEEEALLVKGAVPGARNTLVRLTKAGAGSS